MARERALVWLFHRFRASLLPRLRPWSRIASTPVTSTRSTVHRLRSALLSVLPSANGEERFLRPQPLKAVSQVSLRALSYPSVHAFRSRYRVIPNVVVARASRSPVYSELERETQQLLGRFFAAVEAVVPAGEAEAATTLRDVLFRALGTLPATRSVVTLRRARDIRSGHGE
jgi:hypothetical protein